MSRMNCSLWSLVMGKISAKPIIEMDSATISCPPGARVSGLTVPTKVREDSIVMRSASVHAGLSFLTVHCMTPVESRTNRKINVFPSRLR